MKGHRQPVTIRGVTYPSYCAAARAFGVTVQSVRKMAVAGRADRIGIGQGKKERMPVRIRGVDYADAYAAAAAHGVTVYAVWTALWSGTIDRVGMSRGSGHKPFSVGGLTFPSRREASVALGFRPNYISEFLRKPNRVGRERILAAAMRYAARSQGEVRNAA